jgi:hypothetical protein
MSGDLTAESGLMTDPIIPVPRQRARENAHARCAQLAITDIAARLQEQLGQALLSVIVDRDVRTVARWVSGEVQPPKASEQRLRDTLQVMALLATADAASVTRAWFMGMNPHLNDETPAEVLADGRIREVLVAARAFVNAC